MAMQWARWLARSIRSIPRRLAARVGVGRSHKHDHLPVRPKPYGTRRNEICHYAACASWYELEPRPKRKSLPEFAASGETVPIPRESLVHTDVGILVITSQRIIFEGLQGERRMSFASLEGMRVYQDGFRLERGLQRDPFIAIDENAKEAIEVLRALIGG